MGMRLDDFSGETRKRIERALALQNRTAVPVADVEPPARHEPMAEKKGTRLDSFKGVIVCVHSKRHRLTDPDGASAKAVLDGLVIAKILADDSPEFIKEVRMSQEKIGKDQQEETVVELYEEKGI